MENRLIFLTAQEIKKNRVGFRHVGPLSRSLIIKEFLCKNDCPQLGILKEGLRVLAHLFLEQPQEIPEDPL